MGLSLVLLAVGLLLIFLEFFLPGAVLGILGGLVVIGSIVLFAFATVTVWFVFLYIVGVIILLILLIRFALWKIRNSPPGRSIYLNSDQKGYSASEYPVNLLGKRGITLSDLKPSGFVLIEGQRWQATSTGAYIEKEADVEVIGGEGGHLVVKPIGFYPSSLISQPDKET